MINAAEVRSALEKLSDFLDDEMEDEFDVVEAFVLDRLPPPPPEPPVLTNVGEKIGVRDANGKKLRVGDKVQIVRSCRFGDPIGIVTGPGYKETRLDVYLPDRENAAYTPSRFRVTRIERADVAACDDGLTDDSATVAEMPVDAGVDAGGFEDVVEDE